MIRNFPRQAGKSTMIAKRLKDGEKIIVVQPSNAMAKFFIEKNELNIYQASKVIIAEKLFRRGYKKDREEIYVFDELSHCLSTLGEWESYGTEYIR